MQKWSKKLCLMLALVMVLAVLGGCSSGGGGNASKAPESQAPASQAPATQADTGSDPATDAPATTAGDGGAAAPSGDQRVLRFSTVDSGWIDEDIMAYRKAQHNFIDWIEAEYSDLFTVEIYWGGSLGTTVEAMLGGLQNRNFELLNTNQSLFSEYSNCYMPLDIPYLITSPEETGAVLMGAPGKRMEEKAADETGIRTIGHLFMGFRHMTNSAYPIQKLEDFEGIKLRLMSNPLQIAAFEALGCACTAVAYAELYTALQQKMVDAQENPIANDVDQKFYEVQKYFTYTYHLPALTSFHTSVAEYSEWTPEVQEAFLSKGEEMLTAYTIEQTPILEAKNVEILKENGMEFFDLTPEEMQRIKEATQAATDTYKEVIGADYYDEIVPMIQETIANMS